MIMFFSMVAVALAVGYACTIALGFGFTFALGRLFPSFVANNQHLRPAFVLLSLIAWAAAAYAGANAAELITPFSPLILGIAMGILLVAAMAYNAIQFRKQQRLYYQVACGVACLAGAVAAGTSLFSY